MHPKVADAIQQIDAAVFSGDTFDDPKAREELLTYVDAWQRKLYANRVWEGCPIDDVEFQQRQEREEAVVAKLSEATECVRGL